MSPLRLLFTACSPSSSLSPLSAGFPCGLSSVSLLSPSLPRGSPAASSLVSHICLSHTHLYTFTPASRLRNFLGLLSLRRAGLLGVTHRGSRSGGHSPPNRILCLGLFALTCIGFYSALASFLGVGLLVCFATASCRVAAVSVLSDWNKTSFF